MDKENIQGSKKNFVDWLKNSVEDPNGSVSHRKITTFSFVALFWLMIVLTYFSKNPSTFNDLHWTLTFSGAVGMSSLRILEKRLNR